MKEKMIRFLKSKRAYSAFMRNMKASGLYESLDELIEQWYKLRISHPSVDTPLVPPFAWSAAPEKRAYWQELNDEFKNLIEQ